LIWGRDRFRSRLAPPDAVRQIERRVAIMSTGIIFDIKRFAIHDGPGIRTTVFLKGCPLTCWWCHNPESQSAEPDLIYREHLCVHCGACVEACPEEARSLSNGGVTRAATRCTVCGTCAEVCPSGAVEKVGRRVAAEQIMRKIEKDTPFYDQSGGGVTFSGGEPTNQAGFLGDLLDRCGERDIHRVVDTCGFVKESVLRSIAERTDLFLFDLKLIDPNRHIEYTGTGNDLILSNLRMLSERGSQIHVRVPVIPTATDSEENLDAIGRFVSTLPNLPRVTLLGYHPSAMEKYRRFGMEKHLPDGVAAPSQTELEHIATRLAGHGLQVHY